MSTALSIYTDLYSKKFNSIDDFLRQITDPKHKFYAAARDVGREILSKSQSWAWLGFRLDDFAFEVEREVAKKIQKWYWRSVLGTGKMPVCNDLPKTIKWMIERTINEYKNLFDKDAKNYLDIKKIDDEIKIMTLEKLIEGAGK